VIRQGHTNDEVRPAVAVDTLSVELPGNRTSMLISPTTQLLYGVVSARIKKMGEEIPDFPTFVDICVKEWCRHRGIQLGVYNLDYTKLDLGEDNPL
jgi:hypothetical protein